MIIKKLILENIRSYTKEEITFEKGSTLLAGDIGSGKTSILLGIEFALFGLQPGQRGSLLLRNGETQAKVSMEFEVSGKNIFVERTLKKSKTISQDYAAITIDNEKQELSVTELKNRILELIEYPKEFTKKQNLLYKFTVYTPQEEMKQIILQDSETRVNILRHVFGIDKYKKILENLGIIRLKLREEKRLIEGMTATLEEDKREISSKENMLLDKKTNLVSFAEELLNKNNQRKKAEEEKKEVEEKINEKKRLEQEISKTKIMVLSKNESISNHQKLAAELEKDIQEFQTLKFDKSQLQSLQEEILLKKKQKEKLNTFYLEVNSHISAINFKLQESEALHKKMSDLQTCPTCLQNVDSIYRANILNKTHNEISQSKTRLQELEQEKKSTNEKLNSLDLEISFNEKNTTDLKILEMKAQTIEEKKARLIERNKTNQTLQQDVDFLNKHISDLNDSVLQLSKFNQIFELKQKNLEQALMQERQSDIKVAELRKEIEVFEKNINELKVKVEKTQELKSKLNYITELENWLTKKFTPVVSFIERNVMVKVRTEFSKLFAEWFSILVPGNFNIRLGDDFTPIIENQDYEIDYAYLSGGERTAIALAYRLSLNQVINTLMSKIKTKELVILDEPTDGFSEQQLDKMREVLEQLDVKQLIIVSHEQKMEGFVENVIRFSKQNGISRKE